MSPYYLFFGGVLVGMFVGACFGALIMCLCVAGGRADDVMEREMGLEVVAEAQAGGVAIGRRYRPPMIELEDDLEDEFAGVKGLEDGWRPPQNVGMVYKGKR